MNKSEKIKEYSNKSFEDIEHIDENGIEYLRDFYPKRCHML